MAGQPILPRSDTNPVGGTKQLSRARKSISRAIGQWRRWLLGRLDDIQKRATAVNALAANQTRYEYLISLDELRRLLAEIPMQLPLFLDESILRETLNAYEEGTGEAVTNLSTISDDYTRTVAAVVASEPYQRRASLIRARLFEDMAGFRAQNSSELGRILAQAVEDGLNPMDVRKSLAARFDISVGLAERIARTEITGALRRARWDEAQDAQARLGIETKLMHLSALSATTRATHAARHARLYTVQEVREWYSVDANGINCFLPGTMVQGRFMAGSKARYRGESINLVTRAGRNLSVTPNHPVMTDQGLIAAAEIREGDNLVAYCGEVEDFGGVSNLHGDLTYPRIENVFAALSDFGKARRSWVRRVDFHGDAEFMDEYVDVVDIEGILQFGLESTGAQFLDDLALVSANSSAHGFGAQLLDLNGIRLAASGFMRRCGTLLSAICTYLGVAQRGRFTHAPPLQAGISEPSANRSAGNAERPRKIKHAFACHVEPMQFANSDSLTQNCITRLRSVAAMISQPNKQSGVAEAAPLGKLLDALSGAVALDDVVQIKRGFFDGHVYDLQEVSGLMVADGIITSNCKCSQVEVLVDSDGNPRTPRVIERAKERAERHLKRQKERGN